MEMISQFFLRFQTAFSRPTTQWSEGRPALDFHKGTLFRRGFAQPLDCPTNSKYSIYMLTGYIEFTSCGTEDLGMSHILWNTMFCGIHSVNGLLDPFGFSCLCVVVLRCCFGLYKLWKAQNLVLFYQQELFQQAPTAMKTTARFWLVLICLDPFKLLWICQVTNFLAADFTVGKPRTSDRMSDVERCDPRPCLDDSVPSKATPWLRPLAPTC